MASIKLALFAKNRALEAELDEFFDTVSQGGMLFEEMLRQYSKHGADDLFVQRLKQIAEVESTGDRLVKSIVRALYSDMLIPESRADVLSLLQDIDALLDQYKHLCIALEIERPILDDIPEQFHDTLNELSGIVVLSVETLIAASRAFFRDIHSVRDHLHKVNFLEGEADKIAIFLKREIFQSDLSLDRKMHLRYFVDELDSIADEAEDVADWLAIYTIKRSL